MAEASSISTGIAERYATAVFELARDEGALGALEADVGTLGGLLDESADLRRLIASPVYPRAEIGQAIAALADKAGISTVMRNALGLMSGNRRLFVLPQFVRALRARIAEEKGEVTAEVQSARPLSEAQAGRLAEILKARFGKDVRLDTTVDERLIGGLVVKVGSKMIDTSIRSKLGALKNAMKEVG